MDSALIAPVSSGSVVCVCVSSGLKAVHAASERNTSLAPSRMSGTMQDRPCVSLLSGPSSAIWASRTVDRPAWWMQSMVLLWFCCVCSQFQCCGFALYAWADGIVAASAWELCVPVCSSVTGTVLQFRMRCGLKGVSSWHHVCQSVKVETPKKMFVHVRRTLTDVAALPCKR